MVHLSNYKKAKIGIFSFIIILFIIFFNVCLIIIYPFYLCYRLTVGLENCLFHFQYIDNLEGVFVSSDKDPTGGSQLSKEMLSGFHRCCRHIKQTFDDARKTKVMIPLFCVEVFCFQHNISIIFLGLRL